MVRLRGKLLAILLHVETPTSHCCRFRRWVSSLKVNDNDIVGNMECPSLDVCLVWHAFMLSPKWERSDYR